MQELSVKLVHQDLHLVQPPASLPLVHLDTFYPLQTSVLFVLLPPLLHVTLHVQLLDSTLLDQLVLLVLLHQLLHVNQHV